MAKWIFPRNTSIIRRIAVVGFACWLAMAGIFSTAESVQAATLIISYTGSSLPAVVGTAWSRTYSASGGTAPYTCGMVENIPGLSFNPTNCTLSGKPSDFGRYSAEITFTDDDHPKNSTSETIDFIVEANTKITLQLRSDHPDGAAEYVAGFPVWVNAQVDFTQTIAGKKPTGTISVSSGAGGPTCSVELDANGAGECALIFASASDSKTVQVAYPVGTYVHSSTASSTIQIQSLHVPPSLNSGRNHTCYLANNGLMTCWGLTDAIPVDVNNKPQSQGYFSKISSGGYQTCGLKVDGTIACWGDNTDVTQNIPSGQFVDISSGDEHVCAVDTIHQLHCWGYLDTGFSDVPGEKVTSVSAGVKYDCAILKSNNKPVCWGSSITPTGVAIKALAVGNTHTCAIKSDGSLICWGTPTMTVPTGTNYTSIDSGSNYSCAQKSDGKIACWGSGNPGVDANTVYDQFSSGFLHTCALRPGSPTETLSCWGDNRYKKAPTITISPSSMPQYLVKGNAFNQLFTSSGGNSPYTVLVASGSLPSGLSLSGNSISGTLTTPNTYSFSLSSAETFTGSDLPLQLTPGFQSYSTTVIDGTTTSSISIQSQVDAGSPATVQVTVQTIPPGPTVTGSVLVSSANGDAYCRADVNSSGIAECTLYFSKSGLQTLQAVYDGDAYYHPNTSTANITVNPVVIDPVIGAGKQFSCSIDGNGQPTCWGVDDSNQSTPSTAGVYSQLELGKSHACALSLNHRITCWGWNGYGIATAPSVTNVTKVTTGNSHSCLLTDTGAVTCWGDATSNRLSVVSLGSGYHYDDLDAGADHTCAIVNDGSVKCWGLTTYGQINVPSDLLTRGKITKISSGGTFSCGLHEGGSIECWGGVGVIDSIRTEPDGTFTTVSAGNDFACALKTDGSVNCWGSLSNAPTSLFAKIASGFDHVCGILSDGGMQCWGNNTYGQAPVIAISPDSLTTSDLGSSWEIQTRATGGRVSNYSYGISSGTLPTGLNLNSTTGSISGIPTQAGTYNFTLRAQETNLTPAIAAIKTYGITVRGLVEAKIVSALPAGVMVGRPIKVDFSVLAQSGSSMGVEPTGKATVTAEGNFCEVDLIHGLGSCTMLFADPGTKQIKITYPGDSLYQPDDNLEAIFEYNVIPFSQNPQLRSGLDHTYIYKADGTIGCIGQNCGLSQLMGIYTRLGVGDDYTCGLHTNGEIQCLESENALPLAFSHGPYIDLSVGKSHVCALRIDNQIECMGNNLLGQTTPLPGKFSSLSAGGGHTCALTESGEAVCWGAISSAPAGAITRLVSGDAHTCGLRSDGSVNCWGDNSSGQIAVPETPTAFTEIAAGGAQTCGLDAVGAVTCWGDDTFGQTQPVHGDFTAVTTYDNHVCALRDGLKLTCWGKDDFGEAPQYVYDPLDVSHIPVLSYFEHAFNISGGIKPLSVAVEGSLPPGMDVNVPSGRSTQPPSGIVINDISPAGMIFYGTPKTPGIYPFILKWTDVSPYPLVTEQPYSLTITGGDLKLDLISFSTAEALQGSDYRFKAVVTNKTALPIPDVVLSISLPDGLTEPPMDNPACVLNGSIITCQLGTVNPSESKVTWITGKVVAKSGQTLEMSGSVETTNVDWPEIAPADNLDQLSVPVALKAIVFTEEFDALPFTEWLGGTPQKAPNEQTYLSGKGNETIRLDLTGLPAHKKIIISFDLYVIGGWMGNYPGGDPSEWKFGEEGKTPLIDTTFCNDPICLQAYPGMQPGSAYPGRTGADGLDELGFKIGDIPISDSRYQLKYKFAHSSEDLHLLFSSLNLPDDASWGLDHIKVEIDSGITQVFLPFLVAAH